MARFCSLFSGSSGNCTYIGSSGGGVLVDAGTSAKKITTACEDRGIDLSAIKAIFVTHEHGDHIAGVRVLANRHHIPVIARKGTLAALEEMGVLRGEFPVISMEERGQIAGMEVTSFATSHDCADSCGYVFQTGDGRRLAVCTDLGIVKEEVRKALLGCDLVMMESNHDVGMLQNGPYPFSLKRRILGDLGHLSNGRCADELANLVQHGTTRLVLAHLSRDNNLPLLALRTASSALGAAGLSVGRDYLLGVAPPQGGKMLLL